MCIRAATSTLLLIDLQTRLAPAIDRGDEVLRHNHWLLSVAHALAVPVLATVQYPAGLGMMVPELAALLPAGKVAEKIHFSAVADGCLAGFPEMARPQIVLTGTEAHVCVLQTALDLLAQGKTVFVVEECVGSRDARDKALALQRLRQAGGVLVSREMVAFEWLHRAGTEVFRQVMRDYIR